MLHENMRPVAGKNVSHDASADTRHNSHENEKEIVVLKSRVNRDPHSYDSKNGQAE